MHDFYANITWTPATGAYAQKIELWLDGEYLAMANLASNASSHTTGVLKEREYIAKIFTRNMQGVWSASLDIPFTTPPSLVPAPTGGGVTYQQNP